MLDSLFSPDMALETAQAGGAIALCLGIVVLCRCCAVHVEREAAISIIRGLAQMVFVGIVLALLLRGNLVVGALILVSMTVAAAVTASRRVRSMNGSMSLAFAAIGAGSGATIGAMIVIGALQTSMAILVPVGSMIIANAMNACAQAAERFRADVTAHVGHIEAALALGAEPTAAVGPYVQQAVYASLLPRLDMLKSLGLVWIPGVMAGMMVSGSDPVHAGIYQFIIVTMIMTASGITGLTITLLIRQRIFTAAAQLRLHG